MRGDSKAPAARRAGFASSPAGDDAAGSVWPARPTRSRRLFEHAERGIKAAHDGRPSAQQSGACRCVASHRGHPHRQTQAKVGPVWRSARCRP